MIASYAYVLIAAYQDVTAVNHLRRRLVATLHARAHNRVLKEQLALDQLENQQALAQAQAITTDLKHVAGVLGLNLGSSGAGLPGLLTHLKAVQQELPVVLTAAEQRAEFLAHKPDMLPVNGPITSWFGWRPNPFTGTGREFHPGLDIAVPIGTPVLSVGAGVVIYAGWRPGGYGYYVKVNNGYRMETYFAHNSKVLVHVGETVTRGQVLAVSGTTGRSTGPHVYFGIDYRGVPVNPWPFIHTNPISVN
ncbi:MAG: M23 family metallopeptidase [Thermaerobacter sp.]|nr:M23 family metallopeptidase [Thermaerobacter sp.]